MAKTILVVDDDPELQDLVSFALRREGFEVRVAKDAYQGLEMIGKERFDLALLDVMMPKMDGLEMLSRLRATNQDLHVIIMTALSSGLWRITTNGSNWRRAIFRLKCFRRGQSG